MCVCVCGGGGGGGGVSSNLGGGGGVHFLGRICIGKKINLLQKKKRGGGGEGGKLPGHPPVIQCPFRLLSDFTDA